MNWKQRLSVLLTLTLVSGTISYIRYPLITYAEGSKEAATESKGDSASSSGDSSGSSSSDSSGGSSGDSSGGSSGDSSGGSSGDSSGGSSSDSSGSSSSDSSGGSSDSSGGSSDPSGGSSNNSATDSSGENTSNSSTETTISDGDNTSATNETTNPSDGNTSSTQTSSPSESTQNSSNNPSASTEENKAEQSTTTEKANKKKTIVKDDSNGRDYNPSETVSSGNTTFTIVSVSRNEDELNKQILAQQQLLVSQQQQWKEYQYLLKKNQQKVLDVQKIYDKISVLTSEDSSKALYLLGCRIEGSLLPKEDRIEGLDQALSDLAQKYDNQKLLTWTKLYTTECLPQSVQLSTLDDTNSGLYSSADPILKDMLIPSQTWITSNQPYIDELKGKMEDTQEHIQKLIAAKEAGRIDIDSRLVEYKDKIPDPCIDFLNAVVAKEGTPYVWGASGPNAFDCSGLVSYGLRQCNAVSSGFRWTSQDFASQIQSVSFEEALPGDLVWKPGHIAIYIDENTVFEAPYTGARIRFTSCNVSSRFKRVLRWWKVEEKTETTSQTDTQNNQ